MDFLLRLDAVGFEHIVEDIQHNQVQLVVVADIDIASHPEEDTGVNVVDMEAGNTDHSHDLYLEAGYTDHSLVGLMMQGDMDYHYYQATGHPT
jgi:hypothetical protein